MSTSHAHTPGPWAAETDRLVGGQIRITNLLQVGGSLPAKPRHMTIALVNGTSGEQEANAILIAAAPILLKELKAIIRTDGRECDLGGDIHPLTLDAKCPGCRARAAIALAEGIE